MTDHLPLPSTQIANRKPPRMRFLYPLAAACIALVFLSPPPGEAQAGARLRPDQERAIEMMLRDVDPAMRPMAREQLVKSFAHFTESQIAMVVSRIQANAASAPSAPAPAPEVETVASPEDLAFNKAQYEPVIRQHHAAQKTFDVFANARIDAYCPGRDQYARFGSGWRYEQGQFTQPSALATWNVETNVQVADEAYAPKDGRYRFDFSGVRLTFDENRVDAAIRSVCDKVHAAGRDFLAKIDPVIARKDWDGAFRLEQWAQGRLEPLRAELKAKVGALMPGDFTAIQLALMHGTRIG